MAAGGLRPCGQLGRPRPQPTPPACQRGGRRPLHAGHAAAHLPESRKQSQLARASGPATTSTVAQPHTVPVTSMIIPPWRPDRDAELPQCQRGGGVRAALAPRAECRSVTVASPALHGPALAVTVPAASGPGTPAFCAVWGAAHSLPLAVAGYPRLVARHGVRHGPLAHSLRLHSAHDRDSPVIRIRVG